MSISPMAGAPLLMLRTVGNADPQQWLIGLQWLGQPLWRVRRRRLGFTFLQLARLG